MGKLSNELKKAIEIPVNEQDKGGKINIQYAEPGSIWLIISVGTSAAVNLIAGLSWASAVYRKKRAEAKMFEEYAKTLELKNQALEDLVEAQKTQLKHILNSEAEEIAKGHFKSSSQETIERLKLSIGSISNLIDRGSQILPSSDDKDVIKLFPDYLNLDLIESKIKKLKSENK